MCLGTLVPIQYGTSKSVTMASYSSSILVMQLLTNTTISWNKTEKIGVMILKVYVHIKFYIVLLIVYLHFGKLAPLIMSGVVRVLISKKKKL